MTTRRTAAWLAALSVAALAFAAPALASKNGRLAFQAYPGDLAQVFTIKPDGSGLQQITHVTGDPETSPGAEKPAWSPDGSTIAFDSLDDDGGVSVFTVPAGGGAFTRIAPVLMFNGEPAYSPDGTKLVISADSGPGQAPAHGIFILNSDGTGARQVTSVPAGFPDGYHSRPKWSPNGRWIAFTQALRIHRAAVYVVRVDGTGLRRLTRPKWDAGNPDWSPDGSKLLFNSHFDPRPKQSANIYSIRPDGSHRTKLTHNKGGLRHSWAPSWSPDGRWIAFSNSTPIGKDDGRVDIYTMSPEGTHLRRVTDMPQAFPSNVDWGRRPPGS